VFVPAGTPAPIVARLNGVIEFQPHRMEVPNVPLPDTLLRCIIFSGPMSQLGHFPPPSFVAGRDRCSPETRRRDRRLWRLPPALQNRWDAPYVNAGNRCTFIRELPAGPAVAPPINGSVGAGGSH
jgi:hypothetical protein